MHYLALVTPGLQWTGLIPDLDVRVTGKGEEEVIKRLEAEAGALLTLYNAQGLVWPPVRTKELTDVREDDLPDSGSPRLHWVEPLTPNPISIAIEQALRRSGKTAAAVARLMETSPAALHRMTDPRYDGHSLQSLKKLAQVLQVPLQRFIGLKRLALDEFVAVGHPGMYAPGHVTLKRTVELERLTLPTLVSWNNLFFWLDAPAKPPFALSDADYLRFEGAQIDADGFVLGVLA